MLYYKLLPPNRFIGGYQWGNGRMKPILTTDDMWLIHASWTTHHFDKITKFAQLNAWFYNESCRYFDRELMPKGEGKAFHTSGNIIPKDKRTWSWPDKKPHIWWTGLK